MTRRSNKAATPLWATPMVKFEPNLSYDDHASDVNDDNENIDDIKRSSRKGHYEVVERLITKSPMNGNAEIETAFEIFMGPSSDNDDDADNDCSHQPLWQRVVVKSGPSSPEQTIHASYRLPNHNKEGSPSTRMMNKSAVVPANHTTNNILCWTSFPQYPHHFLLCALANPTLLCIFDVYPLEGQETADLAGEGHFIPLPFEACGIHPVEAQSGCGGGLLLQRVETMEDRNALDVLLTGTGSANGDPDLFDEDGFVLKAPPRPLRLRESTGASSSLGGSFVSSSHHPHLATATVAAASSNIPSLFSLSHPLDDVLPVSHLMAMEGGADHHQYVPGIVTDVFEKILFVGVLRWVDPNEDVLDRREYQQPICVTYHTQHGRHAIWEIKNSPPPPPQASLWQVSGQWRSGNGWDSHLGVFQQDLEDMELLGNFENADVNASHYDPASRNEALADALGVRKTPRKVEDMAPRPRGGAASRSINRGRKVATNNNTGTSTNSNNVSLLSPLSGRPVPETQMMMDVDTSAESSSANRSPLLTIGPFSSLHPKLAMTCLYEENVVSPEAVDVFLASNLEGSGLLTVVLVCPGKDHSNPNELRLISLELQPGSSEMANRGSGTAEVPDGIGKLFKFNSLGAIPCVSAQPLESSAIPACYQPHPRHAKEAWNRLASDILILKRGGQCETSLSLYRSSLKITECSLSRPAADDCSYGPLNDSVPLVDIENAVADRLDIICVNSSQEEVCIRSRISLLADSSFLCEKVLRTLETALVTLGPAGVEIALKIRADYVRLDQVITDDPTKVDGNPISTAVASIRILMSGIFSLLVLEKDSNQFDTNEEKHSETTISAWEQLLRSEYHQGFHSEFDDLFFSKSPSPPTPKPYSKGKEMRLLAFVHSLAIDVTKIHGSGLARTLFDALHCLYEDFKLYNSSRDAGMQLVGSILVNACRMVTGNRYEPFLEHYRRDLGEIWFQQQESIQNEKDTRNFVLSSHKIPPCILSWIDGLLSGNSASSLENGSKGFASNATCTRSRSIFRIFQLLYSSDGCNDQGERDHSVVRGLIEEGFTDPKELRDELPAGVAVPLLEVLHRCRGDHKIDGLSEKDAKMWSLVGREDLRRNVQLANSTPAATTELLQSTDGLALDLTAEQRSRLEDRDKDGVSALEITSSMLFPEDNRIREVGRLLRSSRPVYLNVERAIEVSDHDYERMKQEKLLLLCRRVLALPLGRSMFTIGNLLPVPAEPLPVPDICLVGRVPPTNAMLALDTSECPSDLKVWPEFHNGVAAGLRLPLGKDASETISKITRTWIVYNRPTRTEPAQGQNNANSNGNAQQDLGHAHGGLLMALGLRGHLTTLEMTDIFDYLTQGTVTTTVGVLLGMAANMRGSCDISVSKMLCLHIPSLIPQNFSSIDVSSPVQAAAVCGAGLLYQRSSHRMMTEFLLNEIGKRPSTDGNVSDREAYTLSCGMALGIVNLCQGQDWKENREGGGNAGVADLRIEERLYRYIVGGLDDAEMRRRREETDRLSLPATSASSGNEKCSCVFEGESINTDVTAPGATLALGLIYMMSGNKTIASAVALPDTHFLLEYVRPDFLMLRVISRALIMWDEVEPTREWVIAQLPKAIRVAYEEMREMAEQLSQSAGSEKKANDFDRQAVRLIYIHVIAGACFALGLKYAGTGNKDATGAIFESVMELADLRDGTDPVSCALRPTTPVLEMCLGCAAISLSMVKAGTGDLGVLKLLKILRWRCDDEINYGSHLAYGTAIGLLFLGGGTCTLGREPEDIGALLMAFYPRFPSSTSDNQYHLQALRNLYALAVKHREIKALDVDTGESVYVPIEIHFDEKSVEPLKLTAPCLLSNMDHVPRELRVTSERYYPVTMKLDGASKNIFYVKRRSAHLSYQQDPNSQRSLLVQTGSFQEGSSLDLIASFTSDGKTLAFAQHICDIDKPSKASGAFTLAGFCRKVLHECLILDIQEILPLYVSLRGVIARLENGGVATVASVWDFRMIRSYYQHRNLLVAEKAPRILNGELIVYLIELLETNLCSSTRRSRDALAPAGERDEAIDGPRAVFYDRPLGSTLALGTSDIMDVG